jgi:hypothetical protein
MPFFLFRFHLFTVIKLQQMNVIGFGILGACLITLIASSSINFAYPANDFPVEILGCASFKFLDSNNDSPCPLDIQQTYAAQVMGAAPNEIEFIW